MTHTPIPAQCQNMFDYAEETFPLQSFEWIVEYVACVVGTADSHTRQILIAYCQGR